MANTVKYPFGPADSVALTASGAQAITITNQVTVIDGVTVQSTAGRTLNLTVDASVTAGAKILLKTKFTSTETNVFGTGFLAPTITGVAGKTFSQEFTYDGSTFYPTGTALQLN